MTIFEFDKYCKAHMGAPANIDMDTTRIRRYEGMNFVYSNYETTVKSDKGKNFIHPPLTGFHYTAYCNAVVVSLYPEKNICFMGSDCYITFNNVEKITITTSPAEYFLMRYNINQKLDIDPTSYDVIRITCNDDKHTHHTILAITEIRENGG